MPDHTIQLTRRRLLGGILAIGGASAATGAGTMAYFSDSGTSSNDVVAGTLELEFGGSGSFTFTTSLAPTETTPLSSVTLVNAGTITTGSVDVDVSCTENDASNASSAPKSADDVAQNLEVETLTYGGTDISGQIATSGSTPTLFDLANTDEGSGENVANDLVDLADPGSGGTDFSVQFRLKNVSDDFQGHGVDVEFTFYLNQNDGM